MVNKIADNMTSYTPNKAIAELERLHVKGRKLADDFVHTFEKNRGVFTEDNELARLADLPYTRSKTPSIPPKIQAKADEYEQAVKDATAQWLDDVLVTLKRVAPQARYRLQFNNADETGYTLETAIGLTEQGKRIETMLSDLESRVKTLYKIIIDLDETTEKHIAPEIQRASYDPIARTLYFAGKEISFTKNAKYPPEICRLMFADLKKVDWKLSDFYELWQPDHAYNTPTLEDWQRIQDVIRKFNKRVENKTKISDLFIFNGKSVHLNRNYIG